MNQHKDIIIVPTKICYLYQLNNRTFSTQNTKISARSLAISYICFQVRIVKKKKKKKYYQLLRKIWWLPHPRPPTRALYAKLQREGHSHLDRVGVCGPNTPDDHTLKALKLLKNSRGFRGLNAPLQMEAVGTGPHHVMRRRENYWRLKWIKWGS